MQLIVTPARCRQPAPELAPLGAHRPALRAALGAQLGDRRLHRSGRSGRAGGRAGCRRARHQSAACPLSCRSPPHQPLFALEPSVLERVLPRPRGGAGPRRERRSAGHARRCRLPRRARPGKRRRSRRLPGGMASQAARTRAAVRIVPDAPSGVLERAGQSVPRVPGGDGPGARAAYGVRRAARARLADHGGLVLARLAGAAATPARHRGRRHSHANIENASTSLPGCSGSPTFSSARRRRAPAQAACRSDCIRTSRSR